MFSPQTFLERYHKVILPMLATALTILNFSFSPVSEDFYIFRSLRPLICFSFLLLFLLGSNKNELIRSYLFVFAVASLFSMWFHVQWVAVVTITLETFSLLFLIKLVYPKIKFKNPGTLVSIVLGLVASVCALLLIAFVHTLSTYLTTLVLLISICCLTATFFILLILTFIYNNETNTKSSLVFIFFLIFLVFSEMLRGVGYYAFVDPVIGQQIGRTLLIIGHTLLFHFSYIEYKESKNTRRRRIVSQLGFNDKLK